jgi:acetylornithine deacetylase
MIAGRMARELGLKGDLIVTAVADEEVASIGTSAVADRFRADAAIVTEPTELRLCLAHKGFVWLEVESRGVAAHGSRPDLGVDAIAQMGRILERVVGLDRKLRQGSGHWLLGTGSIHASLIEGGQEWSTYPARCVASLERRTIPGEDGANSVREIEELIASARQEDGAVDASVAVSLERAPSELDADSPVSRAVNQAATEAMGSEPEGIGVAYWMDMALLNEAGIPTVAFGPSGEGAHADVEWVDIASVETCVQVYLRAAELLCGGSGQ